MKEQGQGGKKNDEPNEPCWAQLENEKEELNSYSVKKKGKSACLILLIFMVKWRVTQNSFTSDARR